MSTNRTQPDSFRFIAFRLGDQTFAIDADAVISAHETGVVSSGGTFTYAREELPVVKAADWLGIDDRGHDGRGHFIIIRGPQKHLALQIRGISRSLRIPASDSRPLPPPLDRLVAERYTAILKWSAAVHDHGEKEIVWDSKREEKREELFLLMNHEAFLRDPASQATLSLPAPETASSTEANTESTTDSSTQIPSGTQRPAQLEQALKQRLFLFSPALKSQGERPFSFGISAAQVMEVCRLLPIVPVPGASGHVAGVINWRDEIVPVLRMAEMIGLEGVGAAKAQRLLIAIAPNGHDLVAVQVLSDIRTRQFPMAQVPQPLQNAIVSRYLHGSYEFEHETLVMPNLKSMLRLA
ncbi:MAG: cheW [Planctomycetaceae bacterium]|nr:cheW [Planctomycetaceae bacterium]